MRFIFTLSLLLFTLSFLNAQIHMEEVPLEGNPVLQRTKALETQKQHEKMARLFGPIQAEDRTVNADCEDDGIYEDGETVYVLSGETLDLCLDTIGFATFLNVSGPTSFGAMGSDGNCIIYQADTGIELGLGDTIKVELCLPDGGGCSIRTFPVVVKRANETIIEANTVTSPEMDVTLCADPASFILPDRVTASSVLDCHDLTLASAFNYNTKDSCVYMTSKRFAGMDTICLEVSNDYCISDLHKFPFQVVADTMSLPFLDDFSYEGPYPNNLWLDKEVFVNNTWGYQPPSVGFATMDGLDEGGRPRDNGYGRSDFLTSTYLDLSPYNSGSNVNFSCFVQGKGYGLYPNESDSLVIEFKKSNGQWVQINTNVDIFQGFEGFVPKDSLPPFDNFYSFNIISSDYFYKGFQFRFVNYAQRTGIRDVWHIDYVKLTANDIPDGSFEDITFTNVPNDILKRYSSIPFRHFDNSMLIDSVDVELYSQFDVLKSATSSGLKLTDLGTGTELVDLDELLLLVGLNGEIQANFPPQEHKFYRNSVNLGTLPASAEDRRVFEMEYFFVTDSENPGLFPEVERNNTVKYKTIFDNYFAYDDGSAETGMEIGAQIGEAVAIRFTAAEADTIRAVQVNFPHYNSQASALFNIKIHEGSLGNIIYERTGLDPLFPSALVDTLQGYTTYQMTDDFDELSPVAISAGDFYVEIEQATNIQRTVIGLDKNTPEAKEYQFFKLLGNWVSLGNNGAVMVRPVVGGFTPGSTPVQEILEEDLTIKIFPNPSEGMVNFDLSIDELPNYEISVFNAVGQGLVRKTLQEPRLDLSAFENGIYYLQIKNTVSNKHITRKVVIFRNK